jgi:hypothetical protein
MTGRSRSLDARRSPRAQAKARQLLFKKRRYAPERRGLRALTLGLNLQDLHDLELTLSMSAMPFSTRRTG